MIEIQYIKEAKRIIDSYNSIVKDLEIVEATIKENKEHMDKIKIQIDILHTSNEPNLLKKQQIFEIMASYEKEISKLQNVMDPYIKKLDKLKKESHVLYGILKEKYPGKTDNQLQEIIFKQLDKMEKGA